MGADFIGFMVIGPRELPDFEGVKATVGDMEYQDEATDEVVSLSKAEVIAMLTDFYSFWKFGSRDGMYRDLPDGSRIHCTGEMSWGDAPDGFGYSMLAFIMNTGLNERLGIE
jgi:hypothetical protein